MGDVLQALLKPESSAEKGQLLELVIRDVLEDLEFFNIRRQLSGVQFGFDLVANHRDENGHLEVWKFECKNTSAPIGPGDISPKLIFQFGRSTIDFYVIVGSSQLTNDLHHLLEDHDLPMPIVSWAESHLESVVRRSPRACKRLGVSSVSGESVSRPPIFLPSSPVRLDVVHQMDPPFSFDYLMLDGRPLKAFTDNELRLLATITNRAADAALVNSLTLRTSYYTEEVGRVLRLHKMKGVFEPIELRVAPSSTIGGATDVLGKRMIEVAPRKPEGVAVVFDEAKTRPGLYLLELGLRATVAGKEQRSRTPLLAFHRPRPDMDMLRLYVSGWHYDSPVPAILNLSDRDWTALRTETQRDDQMVFVGPTMGDVTLQTPYTKWRVQAMPMKIETIDGVEGATLDPRTPPVEILDLGLPVEEEVHSLGSAFKAITGQDEFKRVLPHQIVRRMATKTKGEA